MSQSPTQQFVNELLEWMKIHIGDMAFFTNQQLQILYRTWQGEEKMPHTKYVKAALSSITPGDEAIVFMKKDDQDAGKNVTVRGWFIGNTRDWESCNKRQIAKKTADAIAKEVQSSTDSF